MTAPTATTPAWRAEHASSRTVAGSAVAARARAYTDPYVAGVGIGIVLLLAFVVMGRGLGASGAFSSAVAAAVRAGAATHAQGSPAYAPYLADGGLLRDWLVFEMAGVIVGGFLSALLGHRLRAAVERGPRAGLGLRLGAGYWGGVLMGVGARLARGCTSGQALTGGALLSAGSWLFIACAFSAGYLAAPLARRLWT